MVLEGQGPLLQRKDYGSDVWAVRMCRVKEYQRAEIEESCLRKTLGQPHKQLVDRRQLQSALRDDLHKASEQSREM